MQPYATSRRAQGAGAPGTARPRSLGWIAFVVLAFVVRRQDRHEHADQRPSPASATPVAPTASSPAPTPIASTRSVLVQSSTLKADDPAFRAAVADVTTGCAEVDGRHRDRRPRTPRATRTARVSPKRDAALVSFEIPGDPPRTTRVGARSTRPSPPSTPPPRAHPGLRIEQFGARAREDEFMEVFSADLQKAEHRPRCRSRSSSCSSRSARCVAAGIPLLLAITAVVGDDRPRRTAQPARSRGRVHQERHPAHRPRRRRRLRAVLPAPGARGARRRHATPRRRSKRPPRPPGAPCSSRASRS